MEAVQLMGDYNFPVTKRHIRDMVKHYLDGKRETVFKENRPGTKWLRSFLRRHRDKVVIRRPTNIKRSRAAVSPADLNAYFKNLEKEIAGVPASNVFNYDETNLRDDPGAHQCIFRKGVRYPEQVRDHSKTAFTVLFCCSATGNIIEDPQE